MRLAHSVPIGAALALITISVIGSAAGATAQPGCPELTKFLHEAKSASAFPPAQPVTLTNADKDLLRAHPISRFAKKYSKKPVVFQSMHFTESMASMYKGEWVQGQFLKRILQELFPDARFVSDVPKGVSKDAVFELHFADFAEVTPMERMNPSVLSAKNVPKLEEPYLIPMHLVKPLGSRRSISMSRHEIRSRLGIPQEQKVVSLYVRAPDTILDTHSRGASPYQEISKLVDNLHAAYPFDTVILTFGNFDRSSPSAAVASQFILHAKPKLTSVRNVSEALASPQSLPVKSVLMNDTVGNMPYLHRAADMAVVVGPVNFFESIQAGTKTLVIKKTGSLSRASDFWYYDKDILNELAAIGEKTGAMVSVDDYGAIASGVKKLQESPGKVSLDDLSRAAFPRFLDSLLRHLRHVEKGMGGTP